MKNWKIISENFNPFTRARLRFGVLGFGCASSQAVSPIVLLGRMQHKSKTPNLKTPKHQAFDVSYGIRQRLVNFEKMGKLGKIRKNWGELGKIEKICVKSHKRENFRKYVKNLENLEKLG